MIPVGHAGQEPTAIMQAIRRAAVLANLRGGARRGRVKGPLPRVLESRAIPARPPHRMLDLEDPGPTRPGAAGYYSPTDDEPTRVIHDPALWDSFNPPSRGRLAEEDFLPPADPGFAAGPSPAPAFGRGLLGDAWPQPGGDFLARLIALMQARGGATRAPIRGPY